MFCNTLVQMLVSVLEGRIITRKFGQGVTCVSQDPYLFNLYLWPNNQHSPYRMNHIENSM